MSVTKCYLIGGAPLSGKTTLSNLWAAKHQATQLSTDSIREWMKRITQPEDYPRLFYGHELTVEEFYSTYDTSEKVMNQEISQGKDVEKGIESFLMCDLAIERLIIEGIAITPAFAAELQAKRPDMQFETIFLFDDNKERITRRIYDRGLWGPKETYPDYIKEKEVEWVILYNEFYKTEASKHRFPLIHIDNTDSL
jgi:2-phosphoglycerate kinase